MRSGRLDRSSLVGRRGVVGVGLRLLRVVGHLVVSRVSYACLRRVGGLVLLVVGVGRRALVAVLRVVLRRVLGSVVRWLVPGWVLMIFHSILIW